MILLLRNIKKESENHNVSRTLILVYVLVGFSVVYCIGCIFQVDI